MIQTDISFALSFLTIALD